MKRSQCETCKYCDSLDGEPLSGSDAVRCTNYDAIDEYTTHCKELFRGLYRKRETATGQGYYRFMFDAEDCGLYEPMPEPEHIPAKVTKTRLDLSKYERVE